MIDIWKNATLNQFHASLYTLKTCIDQCPDDTWDAMVANLAFCQAVFHAVFYADCYLSHDTDEFLAQDFHRDHPDFFRTYEEMEDRKQELLYDRPTILLYVHHCNDKAAQFIAAETTDSLKAPCGFYWLPICRAELYTYNTRHIQHHAAQLSLRLRLNAGIDIPWVRSGWQRETP